MTASSEVSASGAPAPLDERWRAHAHRLQTDALPEGRVVVSCPAPLDGGGLGRHLREILDALERGDRPNTCLRRPSAGSPAAGRGNDIELAPGWRASLAAPLARCSRAWRMWATSVDFDGAAAGRLPAADHLFAFNGTALAQLERAARSGYSSANLVSATSHVRQVLARHELAHSQYPIERPWVSRLLRRHLEEYRRADRILVSTQYIRDSFLREGHDPARLQQFPLTPTPASPRPGRGKRIARRRSTSSTSAACWWPRASRCCSTRSRAWSTATCVCCSSAAGAPARCVAISSEPAVATRA